MMLAVTYYGKNGDNPLPVSGVSGEDYYYATTQVMIWEVQQQLRVFEQDRNGRITGTKRVAAHGMQADYLPVAERTCKKNVMIFWQKI